MALANLAQLFLHNSPIISKEIETTINLYSLRGWGIGRIGGNPAANASGYFTVSSDGVKSKPPLAASTLRTRTIVLFSVI